MTTQDAVPDVLTGMKQIQKFIWSQGDYPTMSERFAGAGERVADAVGAQPGMRLLDVAAGSGNVAIAAARRGAEVTASDLTPRMIELGRLHTETAGLHVQWCEADAEALPFPDASFDAVTSAFGAMFAPRPDVVAAELVRVVRPGGRIALANWTPESYIGRFAATITALMPSPPGAWPAPAQWGRPEIAQARFGPLCGPVDTSLEHVTFRDESVEAALEFMEATNGPLVAARTLLQDRYPDLREDLLSLIEQCNSASDGSVSIDVQYLLVTARRAAA